MVVPTGCLKTQEFVFTDIFFFFRNPVCQSPVPTALLTRSVSRTLSILVKYCKPRESQSQIEIVLVTVAILYSVKISENLLGSYLSASEKSQRNTN